MLAKQDFLYQSCYCEENSYKLCERLQEKGQTLDNTFVVFISNDSRAVPIWGHKEDGSACLWDYHVIVVSNQQVYDLDCKHRTFPTSGEEYFQFSFQPQIAIRKEFERNFRVIEAVQFLNTFSSDRSHMIQEGETTPKDPPSWPCIRASAATSMNLPAFIEMERNSVPGALMDEDQFLAFLTQ
eukprot:GFYU01014705.1.p1 GENE.GFYU01014705.1~~GFYU01014705.1.p1  ORF type:complete len:183 (-),score=5.59 GFYU01014705.1:434-982(-)